MRQPTSEPAPAEMPAASQPRSILSSAKRIAISTLGSRITGLVRDILLVQTFALGWVQDAFTYAFALPNLFRRLFGEGGLSPVFVPTFTQTLEREGRTAAWKLLGRTLALLTTTLIVIFLVIEMGLLLAWMMSDSAAHERRLLLSLTALMLPFMVTICVLALLAAILNCVGSFVPGALASVVLNVCMIVGIVWVGPAVGGGVPERDVFGVALSVVVAGFLQLVFLWPALRSAGVELRWEFAPRDPAVAGMLRLMPPVALGQGLLAIGAFLDAQICVLLTRTPAMPADAAIHLFGMTIAYPLTDGALSAVGYAQRLYQFPLGVLAISLATAALPAFSRYAARGDWTPWSSEVRALFRMAVFEGVLAGCLMIVLAEPIVRLLFEYRNFDAADTARTARVLSWYGFGLWAFCAQHIVQRAYYSLGDARTPLMISCAVLPLNIAISVGLVWIPQIRESAFAIASSITYGIANIAGLILLQRRKSVSIFDAAMLSALARMLVIGAVCAALVWSALPWWHAWIDAVKLPRIVARSIETLGALGIGAVLFLLLGALVRLPESTALLRRAKRA
ncbi:MAG: murein biosynthesis integral membrane protein MurJ [Phycisphaerales bacterium]|nr:murein biosynthesis integral membrane protein MurJ [Phycisphaerales bacterium]